MSGIPELETYWYFEQEWESYDELRSWFEWKIPDQFNIADYVCTRWASSKNRVAIFSENEAGDRVTYTFWQLEQYSNALANYLRDRGIEPGDRVGVNVPQKPETVIAHVAAWKCGAVTIPLSVLFGTEGLGYRLDDSDAAACFVDESNLELFQSVRDDLDALETVVTVDCETSADDEVEVWEAIDGRSTEFQTVSTAATDDALIMYTSGTTGSPKGAVLPHQNLLGHLPLWIMTHCNMELTNDDVFWIPAEWSWIASLFDLVFPALYYGKPVLAYDSSRFDGETAFDLMERYGLTVCLLPPASMRMMRAADAAEGYDLDSVRCIPSGGEAVGKSIIQWANDTFGDVVIHECYGQTEADGLLGNSTALEEIKPGTLGRPGPGHDVRIVDPDTAEPTVDPGDVGEIAVRYEDNPVCMKEYWKKPEKTEDKIQNGWLLTEDLGVEDEDGFVTFVSRKDDVIISAGYRIGPEEIEDTLESHDSVAEAGVIGVSDDVRGEVPKAFVATTESGPSDDLRPELQSFVKDELAKYEYPREIEFVDELPKTSTQKLRRTELRKWEDES